MVVNINHAVVTRINPEVLDMQTPINGYYSVNDKIYLNKFEALLAATENRGQVHWHWHPEYDQVNWQIDSPLSLKEVYRLRAQQLRDKYNYLVLSFSGGSDSWTVLHTFVSNNIRLDEVHVRWPIAAAEKSYQANTIDKTPSNLLSEWDYAIKPQLELLKKNYPGIRITVNDISKDSVETKFDDNLITQANDCLNAGWWSKYASMSEQERKILDHDGSVGFIIAIDKPQILVKNHQVHCYFIDVLTNSSLPPNTNRRSVEFFYWSRDMPEVTHVQARAIYNHMKSSPETSQLVQFGTHDATKKYMWDMYVKGIIYSDYSRDTFQEMKTTNLVYNNNDAWLMKVMDPYQFQAWESMINNLRTSLDQRYIKYENNKMSGVTNYISNLYYLGDLPAITMQ